MAETDWPEPIPTEVLVRVKAARVNRVDWETRAGKGCSTPSREAAILIACFA